MGRKVVHVPDESQAINIMKETVRSRYSPCRLVVDVKSLAESLQPFIRVTDITRRSLLRNDIGHNHISLRVQFLQVFRAGFSFGSEFEGSNDRLGGDGSGSGRHYE